MKRFDSEHRMMISRTTQAKVAIERVIDLLAPEFDMALSMALDRLNSLREQAESQLIGPK